MAELKFLSFALLFLFAVPFTCCFSGLDRMSADYSSRFFHASAYASGRSHGSKVANRVSLPRSTHAVDRRLLVSKAGSSMKARAPAPSRLEPPPTNNTLSTPAVKSSPPTTSPTHKKVYDWMSGLAVGIGAGAVTSMLLVVFTRLILKRLRGEPVERTIIFQHKWVKGKSLAFLEIKDCFEGMELLGAGGSGKVYKAVLQDGTENGMLVAIKKVLPLVNIPNRSPNEVLEKSYDLTKNSKQVHAELRTLGHVRHRNLLALLAYVPREEAHLLIYEFMENGSLRDALIKVAKGSLSLTWPMRHNIAIGVITAMKYLHFDCKPCIVHRDIKPGNILLDREFEPHLGDFGLAKVVPDPFSHFTTENIPGTLGYIAPEYHQTMKHTTKGDIFSFGVVLSVLLTGKEPSSEMFSDVQTNMGVWVTDLLASGREAVLEKLDPSLQNQGFDENLLLAFKISAVCAAQSPSSRPSSVDVLVMLRQIAPGNNPAGAM